MTLIVNEEAQCALCGTNALYPCVLSTHQFGATDLDTRPPEGKRSTIHTWVQRCPGCGYVGTHVAEAPPEALAVVRSPAYMRQLNDPSYPELANSFLCKALIDEACGNFAKAAWALIHAAWVCDDAESPKAAEKCRTRAADMIEKAWANGQKLSSQEGADGAIRVDVLRRAGRFEEAQRLIETLRPSTRNRIIRSVLDLEEALIAKRDTACHTLEEVPSRARQ